MKKIRLILYWIILILLAGCAGYKTNDADSRSVPQDSLFKDFFVQFSRDSLFQISRIKFPLKYSYFEEYNDSLKVVRIEAKDWNYINFEDDSLAYKSNEDAYQIHFIEKDDDRVEYLRKGIDNGINIDYTFRRIVRQWFLVEIVDRSN